MNISVSGDGVFFLRLQHQHAALPVQHRSLVRISQAQQHMEGMQMACLSGIIAFAVYGKVGMVFI